METIEVAKPYLVDRGKTHNRGKVRIVLLIGLVVLMPTVRPGIYANQPKLYPLRLTLAIVDQGRCQYLDDTQVITLHAKLRFMNVGKTDLVIQQIDGLDLTILAHSLGDIRRGVHALYSGSERFEPERRGDMLPTILKAESVFETTEVIGIMVDRSMSRMRPALLDHVKPGHYYLQIGEGVIVGNVKPNTLRSITVRSAPIEFGVEYSDATNDTCSRSKP